MLTETKCYVSVQRCCSLSMLITTERYINLIYVVLEHTSTRYNCSSYSPHISFKKWSRIAKILLQVVYICRIIVRSNCTMMRLNYSCVKRKIINLLIKDINYLLIRIHCIRLFSRLSNIFFWGGGGCNNHFKFTKIHKTQKWYDPVYFVFRNDILVFISIFAIFETRKKSQILYTVINTRCLYKDKIWTSCHFRGHAFHKGKAPRFLAP